jgi:Fe-S-cluster containining protein
MTMTHPAKADIFTCARCGFCCHGETTVSLDERDQERMIRVLGLSREEMARRYWRITGSVVQMQVRDGHCIFYDDRCGCTVHEGRPWRCRQWPLHPSMLDDENNYRTISESCPGIRTDIDYGEFCRILRILLDRSADGRLGE